MLAVDGTDPQELRKMMELDLDNQMEHSDKVAQVFEAAGGFAPTIGIIGAVLGLIQVMQHLAEHRRGGQGDRSGVCRHDLWRGFRQPIVPAIGGQAEDQEPRGAGAGGK